MKKKSFSLTRIKRDKSLRRAEVTESMEAEEAEKGLVSGIPNTRVVYFLEDSGQQCTNNLVLQNVLLPLFVLQMC